MRRRVLVSFLVPAALIAAAARAAVAQPVTSSPPDAAAQTAQPPAGRTLLTLESCVESAAPARAHFTLFDPHHGVMYRLTGPRQSLFAGRRVQVVGALVPTPNIAAQAGSIDSVTTAVATANLNLSGSTPFNRPKGHVEEIRPLPRCGP